jgi:hypothetical protein
MALAPPPVPVRRDLFVVGIFAVQGLTPCRQTPCHDVLSFVTSHPNRKLPPEC